MKHKKVWGKERIYDTMFPTFPTVRNIATNLQYFVMSRQDFISITVHLSVSFQSYGCWLKHILNLPTALIFYLHTFLFLIIYYNFVTLFYTVFICMKECMYDKTFIALLIVWNNVCNLKYFRFFLLLGGNAPTDLLLG